MSKTDALLALGYLACKKYPGCNVLYLRRTFADLNKPGSAIPRSQELWHGLTKWDGESHRHTFPGNGSLTFGHLQHQRNLYDYQGAQIDLLLFDELTQFEEHEFDFLATRVRSTVPGIRPRIRAASNPGGRGHAWVRKRFVDRSAWGQPFEAIDAEGRPIEDPVTGEHYTGVFIPARVDDNPALLDRDPGYKKRLELLPDALRRAYLDGDWDIFAGMFFTEWNREVHVCKPFAIPAGWPRWRGVDYGYHAPFCCLWLARSPDRQIFVYRELYETGLRDEDQAVRIQALSYGENIAVTYGDPSMWNHDGGGIGPVYTSHGVPIIQANNDRLMGWQRVRQALQEEPALQVFETCQNLIRTLPAQVYDEHRVEDLNSQGEDHACLVAGTTVTTNRGQVPIECVTVADRVWTRAGWRRVLAAERTSTAAPTLIVRLSDGRCLQGTGNHPIWVHGKGWTRLDALRYGDRVRQRVPVHVVGVSDADTEPVWNLRVEGEPEFYANGVLTHNCDALRYALMGARQLQQVAGGVTKYGLGR